MTFYSTAPIGLVTSIRFLTYYFWMSYTHTAVIVVNTDKVSSLALNVHHHLLLLTRLDTWLSANTTVVTIGAYMTMLKIIWRSFTNPVQLYSHTAAVLVAIVVESTTIITHSYFIYFLCISVTTNFCSRACTHSCII